MSSNINTSNINANFPIQGEDNPSQGFRDNFFYIAAQLNVAASEITDLQNNPVGVNNATTSTTGVVQVGNGLAVNESGVLTNPFILPAYTTSTLTTSTIGALALVTDAPGGSQPCFYDGTYWYTIDGRIRVV